MSAECRVISDQWKTLVLECGLMSAFRSLLLEVAFWSVDDGEGDEEEGGDSHEGAEEPEVCGSVETELAAGEGGFLEGLPFPAVG